MITSLLTLWTPSGFEAGLSGQVCQHTSVPSACLDVGLLRYEPRIASNNRDTSSVAIH